MPTPPIYHLFQSPNGRMIANYIVAGDGIYGVMECFGFRIPIPVLPCEVRGIPPLSPWLHGGMLPPEMDDQGDAHEVLACAPSYHILTPDHPTPPPIDANRVYQYIVAREGVFLQARGTGLQVCMPITEHADLPGLASASPFIRSAYPPVNEAMTMKILERSRLAHNHVGQAIERLFYLLWVDGAWHLHEPEQDASVEHVRARHSTQQYMDAFIEGHSHHIFEAFFSPGDDRAEVQNGGFRVYFVLGRIFSQPEIRVRICVHGYEWEVPAHFFFSLPHGMVDRVAQAWSGIA